MMSLPDWLIHWADEQPWAYTVMALAVLLGAVWLTNLITKHVLMQLVRRMLAATALGKDPTIGLEKVITRLAHIVPALVLWVGIGAVPDLPESAIIVVRNVSNAYIVLTVALALSALLYTINVIYSRRPEANDRPIKGYLQVIQIIVFAVATILIIASLLDRSPLILLSGLGAMAAVLMLIFQDTLLSLAASVQISSNDMVRVGDWIEMPLLNADGTVIDIALHTVKVQNWDRTITTIPTKRLIADSFKNWRGMEESGGRRIKRALHIDQNSLCFLSEEEQAKLRRFAVLGDYLDEKHAELQEWNAKLIAQGQDPINNRQVTNLGTFRAYIVGYLRKHAGVHQEMTLMARQLSPGPQGLPIEVYCFTRSTAWVIHEGVQSDIFDHLLTVLPEFGLRVFQQPSGPDVRMALARIDMGN
ncbi:mechanosensitive ion channel protein MscS [Candidatus Tenderia electrophaga]|uniref:Mechanosensitive ion channel protein MscS n=1 Tax=Candidatus Tenderia electrophaga TaxID=1748243 RepID=A0A0S2TIA4_9GAMM|nr:mechanosensitive ion channel protein MscS [Candidatus Tenderia electrophaga]